MKQLFADIQADPEQEIQALKKRIAREKKARAAAEELLDEKSRELYYAGKSLQKEAEVSRKTAEQLSETLEELKATQAQLIQASKMESLGTLAGGIAHEINTPSQFVGDNLRFLGDSYADLMKLIAAYEKGETSDRIAEITEEIELDYLREEIPLATDQALDGTKRINEIVLAMKTFAHPDQETANDVDLNQVISSATIVCRNEWKHLAKLEMQLTEPAPILQGFAGQLSQLVINLVVNAAHAIEETERPDGLITIKTKQAGKFIEMEISDNGAGIPDTIASQIFDPFFTTKTVGRGTGQGLTMCHDIATVKHGGRIAFNSQAGEGTVFTISLPVSTG